MRSSSGIAHWFRGPGETGSDDCGGAQNPARYRAAVDLFH
jgi:hypothetical protein